jgi:DNA-binding FadR family transcriptional regulator
VSGDAPAFTPLKLAPGYRRVAESIAARIRGRSLATGEPLPTEVELAAQLGVTRSTLREALRELESQGLLARRRGTKRMVVSRPDTAAVVTQVSHALAMHDVTVAEVCDALLLLEPPLAERAAHAATVPQLRAVEAAAATFRASRDTPSALQAVTEFFEAVDAATGNRALQMAQRPLLPLLQGSLRLVIDRVPQARARIALAQRRLSTAIAARDSSAARDWMDKHIRDLRRGFEVAGIALGTAVRPPD